MTQISIDDVQHLAQLSNLQLSNDEMNAMQQDISSILGYIEQLQELDTTGVEPTYQVTDLVNVSRNDVIESQIVDRDTLLSLAPEQVNGQVKVPKVL